MTSVSLTLTLPWPPSTNRYWRHVGTRTLLSRDGRAYKARVSGEAAWQLGVPVPKLAGPVAVRVDLYPPDRRRRDIDNHAGKALLDAIAEAGVLDDDSQIRDLHAVMHSPVKGGSCRVSLAVMESD
ncbi:MAG: RusA family crossover junction endodeoxyribonuclease [Halieaceae bacterium]|jgi:crossover junction endodeoxyribonuclease RusA|nr:RusA family crossover junction endodeoxyribonuclease [Halieaceae bacterium]